ncbi:MAG: type I-MYXAN CRISPR-associated protein Cas6/Cmx6 [Bryobacteraceae bacterium]
MSIIDLSFPIAGREIPVDHGYFLYSALSHRLPGLHTGEDESRKGAGIHPIEGKLMGNRRLGLIASSRMTVRVDSGMIGEFLPLVGETLRLGEEAITLGSPEVRPLRPAARLSSRLVVVKGFTEPEALLEAVRRQLAAAGIEAEIGIPLRQSGLSYEGQEGRAEMSPVRRTMQIRDKQIVGYPVMAMGLDAEDSIRLQEIGVGGRRHFGCGVFVPARS